MAKKDKILYIDGQVFQSAAWERGMGKYSLELIRSMLANTHFDYAKVYILFTRHLPLHKDVVSAVKKAAPQAYQLVVDVRVPEDPCTVDIAKMRSMNESVLDATIKGHTPNSLSVDFIIMSLFIDQVCSVFPSITINKKILLFYDLIPFQYYEKYRKLCSYNNYLARYKTLFDADLIWTISQTVADDLTINLGISPAKIGNIDGAPIARNKASSRRLDIALPDHFTLMPSGNDLRKNNARAIQGFEAFRRTLPPDDDTKLVLTSYFDDATRKSLEPYSSNLIFTGNVEENELQWLYENADALLFVPEYEGLGLPILEAAEANKPIICSNIAVFNEISKDAFYYADPFDPQSISEALIAAYNKIDLAQKVAAYPAILARYTWFDTANKAFQTRDDLISPYSTVEKKCIAIFAPSPASYSDVGKRVMQLHASMREYFDIDYYLETGRGKQTFSRPNYLPYLAPCYPASEFNNTVYNKYDAVIYNIGNSEFHLDTIKNALYLPGYAVFHDTHLKNIFEIDLQYYGYITKDRYRAEKSLNSLTPGKKSSFIQSLAQNQLASIVHSKYAQVAISKIVRDRAEVVKLNLPLAVPRQLVSRLTSEAEHITLGFAGVIHPAKGLDIIENVVRSKNLQNCRIHIFGISLVGQDILRRLSSYPNVSVDTDVTDFQFQNMLSKVDILVNFRKEYHGETSAATLEAMRYGAISIVRNIGWYSELPDECLVKVDNVDELTEKIEQLILDTKRYTAVRNNARKLLSTEYTYDIYAKGVYDLTSKPVSNANAKVRSLINQNLPKEIIIKKLSATD